MPTGRMIGIGKEEHVFMVLFLCKYAHSFAPYSSILYVIATSRTISLCHLLLYVTELLHCTSHHIADIIECPFRHSRVLIAAQTYPSTRFVVVQIHLAACFRGGALAQSILAATVAGA